MRSAAAKKLTIPSPRKRFEVLASRRGYRSCRSVIEMPPGNSPDCLTCNMEFPILSVEGLSKQYTLTQQGQGSILQDFWQGLKHFLGKGEGQSTSFWAIEDISFELQKGDVLGIVGRNGAGKSTLLRILSEVTPPTKGKVTFRGTVTSILDVGTGFHPDLSGRQNVYMSAAINGMDRQQIRERFDEIVAFSGIERFIDMPVKHYSAGMYMRLAFSVAFHSQSDILLLDEVLSVGDVEFRLRSAQKIKQIARSGTTVLIVSHELPSIRNLCNKCMLIEAGKIRAFGPTKDIVDEYMQQYLDDMVFFYRSPDNPDQELTSRVLEHENVAFLSMTIGAAGKTVDSPIYMADAVEIKIRYRKKTDFTKLEILLNINNLESVLMSDCRIYREDFEFQPMAAGEYETKVTVPGNLFYTGTFYVDLYFGDLEKLLLELPCVQRFTVEITPWEVGKQWNQGQQDYALRPALEWELRRLDA
jgi:lipopolysaccharide transport system ATP-binding protein